MQQALKLLSMNINKIPVLAGMHWGGYLIYRLYPRVKVAVDDRHDFYGEAFLKSYLKMMHAEPGWQDFLEQYRFGYVVIPKDSALANVLAETPIGNCSTGTTRQSSSSRPKSHLLKEAMRTAPACVEPLRSHA